MKFIKLFEQHTEYETYINSNDKVLPNISYCENENEVHYNPWVETRIIATFNVTSSFLFDLFGSNCESLFSEIEVDGVVQPSVNRSYTFATTGEHTVKYTLANPTTIGTNAFQDCKFTNVVIPRSVTTIENNAFYNCTNLTNITIPNSVTTIGQYAFRYDNKLNSIKLNGVISIDYGVFEDCDGLTSVMLSDTLTSIGSYAFYNCANLKNITIPNSVTTINSNAFNSCYFTTSAFVNNSSLDETNNNFWGATIIDSDIDGFCIKNNSIVKYRGIETNVTIPNNVTSIGANAFRYCKNIISITLSSNLTSIEGRAFGECTNLTTITSLSATAPTITSATFRDIQTGGTLYVPSGSTGYDTWMGTGNYYLGK